MNGTPMSEAAIPLPKRRMLALGRVKRSDVVYDLGCGAGRTVAARADRPHTRQDLVCMDHHARPPMDRDAAMKKNAAHLRGQRSFRIWWEVQVSNLRPLQCECSALPLS
ncbi:hypothetical protein MASSI9I_50084 [Massilia sp. 9I]|nr:hypothetical protein MASSI9I_50084 [Massilia sp. 9I]